jgi:hypothetical protein
MVEDRKSSAHGQNDAIDPERSLHSSEANTEFQVFPGAACEEAFSLFTPACEMRLVPLHQFPNTQTPPTSRASMVCWAFDTARIK